MERLNGGVSDYYSYPGILTHLFPAAVSFGASCPFSSIPHLIPVGIAARERVMKKPNKLKGVAVRVLLRTRADLQGLQPFQCLIYNPRYLHEQGPFPLMVVPRCDPSGNAYWMQLHNTTPMTLGHLFY